MDCGFFSKHSRFIEGFLQNLDVGSLAVEPRNFPIMVNVPRLFCPLTVAIEDVRDALAVLYYPDRFPIEPDKIGRIAEVADFFDIPLLMHKADQALLEQLRQRIVRHNGVPMRFMWFGETEWSQLMEALLLADRFKLKKSWSRMKQGILTSLDDVGQLIDQPDFRKLSASAQLDVLEGCVRKHMTYVKHNWK